VASTKRLRVTEFDFDSVKQNLKTFLKGQREFTDYDFEGSGMNILLDTLAYNTHYLGFNANMLANEMFLDSASLRSSIVSHAKMLGYEVSSPRAPVATINVTLTTNNATATMPAGTTFNTTVDGVNFQFVTISDITSRNTGSSIPFDSLEIYEGTFTKTKYIVDSQEADQRFMLADNRADIETLTVKVQNSTSDTTTTTYTKATDITQLTKDSTVYFCQETESGRFQIYFGDGATSKGLSDGNIVELSYVITNKTAANGASSFVRTEAIDTVTNISVTTVANASGGAEGESSSSIKLNAPLDYASQGRAVTAEDYKVYVRKLFPNTQAVSVWGGEDGSFDTSTGVSSTPEYGKVFISVKSTTSLNLTTSQKENLVKDLSPFKVASITPVIVDPETTFIILGITFNFNSTATTQSKTDLETSVTDAISNFTDSNLEDFNLPFRHSLVTGLIDDVDSAITNNTTTVTLGKFFKPSLTTSTNYTVSFNNALYNPHSGHNSGGGGVIASTGFQIDGDTSTEYFFDEDGSGNLRTYSIVSGTRTYLNSTAGSVDYANGIITINALKITAVSNIDGEISSSIRVTAIPSSNDVIPVRNQILEIDLVNTTITGQVDNTATTGVGYTTSSTGTTTTTSVPTTTAYPTSSSY
tara:strand:+ start:1616 stop:3544 length:1929 start_codon:yes stop_codon:yes gene_type:complete